ncbi:diacylglycerol kinase [Cerasicoccus fimbriatus]|uniref:diacylglycerol kinase n=1 Tax=Cerasicoccus fimbriatus TaxID=3014554 RepID=UPI0022B2AD0E|nr:diacylglycerol kinase [Cerasicoccus sp. TK19100]
MLQQNHDYTEVREDKSRGGLKRIWNAMFYSFEGIGSSLKHESAFRQEMLLACILIPTAIMLPVGLLGKALMIGSIFLVLVVELMNSALEWTVDYISQETHPFAKRAKDMGSGAVFFALLNVAVMWGLVITEAIRDGRLSF